jgi:hypothetical protein
MCEMLSLSIIMKRLLNTNTFTQNNWIYFFKRKKLDLFRYSLFLISNLL